MDSLRLGMLSVAVNPDRLQRLRRERAFAKAHQHEVLGWIAKKKLSHSDLATQLRVTPSTVCGVLTGKAQLPPRWIVPLAGLLDVTSEQLRAAWRPWRQRKRIATLSCQEEYARLVLAELMTARSVQQATLAKAIGVRQSDISLVVRGRKRMSLLWHDPLAKFFRVPVTIFHTDIQEVVVPVKPKRERRQPVLVEPLAQFLRQMKFTQMQAAAWLGTNQPTVSRVLRGQIPIPAAWIPAITLQEK